MSLRAIGGIFWRLDASGNLTAFDTTGSTLAKFIGGVFSAKGNEVDADSQNTAIASTTSILPTFVFSGDNYTITPQVSTRIIVAATLAGSNGTAGDGGAMTVYRNAGSTLRAGGAATAGTQVGTTNALQQEISAVGGNRFSLTFIAIDTGLTVGTTYTYSIAVAAVTGGTFSFSTPITFLGEF